MAIKPLLCPSSVYGIFYVLKFLHKDFIFNFLSLQRSVFCIITFLIGALFYHAMLVVCRYVHTFNLAEY